jgi:hypothetical protein
MPYLTPTSPAQVRDRVANGVITKNVTNGDKTTSLQIPDVAPEVSEYVY